MFSYCNGRGCVTLDPFVVPRVPRGRFEAVGAFMIALMLMGAGYSIGNHSFETLVEVANPASRSVPTRLAALAATISIVAKEALFRVS